ncbi:MAG: single-stranded DNA-binding protein [Clostridiales bacterium]|nr:single-stranded DNA-binding protein [Clostridiales bacterium]
MENPNNRIVAAGRLEDMPVLSHEVMREPFYTGMLLVKRLSGAMDRVPVTIPGKILALSDNPVGRLLLFQGQVRSYNKVVDGAGRLMVTMFVQSMYETQENETLNKVSLVGALCKPPIYRSTPFGREICDMMLAVNRAFGKSDYIPCIAWGRNAQYAARFRVGDRLKLTGRLQSREYQKLMDNGEYLVRNAYEVSAFTLEATDAAPDFASAPPVDTRLEFERLRQEETRTAE